MEAAGGVKSTIEALAKFYPAYLAAIIDQTSSNTDSMSNSIFRNCRDIVPGHARLPGPSLREQGYGAGLAPSQLRGQLGRIPLNVLVVPEPIVRKNSGCRLVLYHHGSMLGSTSCVHLIPDLDAFIAVIQSSLAPNDTIDFLCQYHLESFLNTENPKQLLAVGRRAYSLVSHTNRIKNKLDK